MLVGQSSVFLSTLGVIKKVANSTLPVLFVGESGTGKRLLARYLHEISNRADQPLVTLNCSSLNDSLLESELFGYEKGAFTGATKRSIGKFEAANGGTLFLDEVCDMSLTMQAKFLRALDDGKFYRVGGAQLIQSDVRIVSATNKQVGREVKCKNFRSDLLFRICGLVVTVPPLRDRKEDIVLIANYFLKECSKLWSLNGIYFSDYSLEMLKEHDWLGNIRELKISIERAVLLRDSNEIDIDPFDITKF